MSTKGTIFLTKDNEHCYDETSIIDGDQFRLVLEIDYGNIIEYEYNKIDGLTIDIKGDSQIAGILRQLYGKGE